MKKQRLLAMALSFSTVCAGMSMFAQAEEEREKYDPEITITIGKQLDENTGRYGDGEDINKNPMTELTREKLGIKMETVLLGGDAGNYDTKLRLALTSADELPDVFPVYSAQLAADMIESGMVRAIEEDIEKYLPDRLKEIYDKYPTTFNTVSSDGHIYGLAVNPHLTEGQVMIIRQDWLDKLGLTAPTTIEEFEAVIKAFTEDDPDGDGQKNTYGFTYEGDSIYNNGWCADPVTIFSVYTGKFLPGQWQEDEEGNLVYGSLNPGNKEALAKMAEWHANGWIFPEAAATGAWDAMTQFTEGKAGIFIGRPWCIDSVADVKSVAPDAIVKAYPNILQINGEMTYQDAELNDGWFMFRRDFDNMEAFFTYYDWMYDAAFGTGDFAYGYLDGYDYQIQGDTVVFDSEKFDPPVSDPFMPGKSTVLKNTPTLGAMPAYASVYAGNEPATSAEIRAAAHFESSYNAAEGYAIANDYADYQIQSVFKAAPTRSMARYWEQLQTMEKQTFTNIIYGKESPDAFDEFVENWHAQGGDEITQEINEWYQSIK